MSPDETKRLLAVAQNRQDPRAQGSADGCGLRGGEVVRLKVNCIDSAQKISLEHRKAARIAETVIIECKSFRMKDEIDEKVEPQR